MEGKEVEMEGKEEEEKKEEAKNEKNIGLEKKKFGAFNVLINHIRRSQGEREREIPTPHTAV